MKPDSDHFRKQVDERLNMIVRSAQAYDAGEYYEALRLSSSIAKLVGDRSGKGGAPSEKWVSLASRAGVKPISMIDSSFYDDIVTPKMRGPIMSLGFGVNGLEGWVPRLGGFVERGAENYRTKPFDDWWLSPVVRDSRGVVHTRKSLVETMRDKEDAHTDAELAPDYGSLAYRGGLGIKQFSESATKSLDLNPARVAVRQIAHEVIASFRPEAVIPLLDRCGMLISPVCLAIVKIAGEDGKLTDLPEDFPLSIGSEYTGDPKLWALWEKEMSSGDDDLQGKVEFIPRRGIDLSVQFAFFHFGPHDLKGLQCWVKGGAGSP